MFVEVSDFLQKELISTDFILMMNWMFLTAKPCSILKGALQLQAHSDCLTLTIIFLFTKHLWFSVITSSLAAPAPVSMTAGSHDRAVCSHDRAVLIPLICQFWDAPGLFMCKRDFAKPHMTRKHLNKVSAWILEWSCNNKSNLLS